MHHTLDIGYITEDWPFNKKLLSHKFSLLIKPSVSIAITNPQSFQSMFWGLVTWTIFHKLSSIMIISGEKDWITSKMFVHFLK